MIPSADKYVVLVTGGSGCLGQHVIGLLQEHAPYVTEIRIIELPSNPYINKLDYVASKPVKQFLGSINDRNLVREACQGVHCVMHIASIIDVSMFPDIDKLQHVNVQGTSLLLEVSKELGVERFIYCSTITVVIGDKEIFNGTEATTTVPDVFFFDGYASTKRKAEELVLAANCQTFRTLSIRPTTIYGEEDNYSVTEPLRFANKFGRWSRVDCKDTVHQMTYAGNIAWTFICADKALKQDKRNAVDGKAFFTTDDTPLTDMFEFQATFVKACGYATDTFRIPAFIALYSMYLLYAILWLISLVVKVNLYSGIPGARFLRKTCTFKSDLAKKMLGYVPLYSYEESRKRSLEFYSRKFHL